MKIAFAIALGLVPRPLMLFMSYDVCRHYVPTLPDLAWWQLWVMTATIEITFAGHTPASDEKDPEAALLSALIKSIMQAALVALIWAVAT